MECIKVYSRCRPLNESEILSCDDNIWHISESKRSIDLSHFATKKLKDLHKYQTNYTFDSCFGENIDNEQVYTSCVQPILNSALEGISCTFMVYGQTGAGKTFTMNGHAHNQADDSFIDLESSPGILFKASKDILQMIQNSGKEIILRISFVEIYNDQTYDLLGDVGEPLNLVEDVTKREFVIRGSNHNEGVNEIKVNSLEEISDLLRKGEVNRHYAENFMNHLSSRSHIVFRFSLSIMISDKLISSTLNFVDLAGSERLTNYEMNNECEVFEYFSSLSEFALKERMKEGLAINKSLFFLAHVISMKSAGIPYSTLIKRFFDSISKFNSDKTFEKFT